MNLHETRTRRSRRFHCEWLEDRNLLSAGIATGVPGEIRAMTSKGATQVIKGSIDGYFAVGGTLEVGLKGSGNLSVMGETTVIGEYKLGENVRTHKATASGGTVTFTGGTGTVSASFSGTGKTTSGVFAFSMKGKVTGGTGAFSGATGTFIAKGTSAADVYFGSFGMKVTLKTKIRS